MIPPPLAVEDALVDSGVTIGFYGWVNQKQHSFVKVTGEAMRKVKLALEVAGRDLPEPIQRVLIELRDSGTAASQTRHRLERSRRMLDRAASAGDMALDHFLDEQVLEETQRSRGSNLLLDETSEGPS